MVLDKLEATQKALHRFDSAIEATQRIVSHFHTSAVGSIGDLVQGGTTVRLHVPGASTDGYSNRSSYKVVVADTQLEIRILPWEFDVTLSRQSSMERSSLALVFRLFSEGSVLDTPALAISLINHDGNRAYDLQYGNEAHLLWHGDSDNEQIASAILALLDNRRVGSDPRLPRSLYRKPPKPWWKIW